MQEVGLNSYRMSISWPRILPNGTGTVNQKGLDFYTKLVDNLLEAGIVPFITLYHWDLPLELHYRGGWLNRDVSNWFAEYTRIVIEKLSDRAKNWITFNEPQAFIHLGYNSGVHAPGEHHDWAELLRMSHNVLLAHGNAVQTIRMYGEPGCKVGFAPVGCVNIPETNAVDAINVARLATFDTPMHEGVTNAWWMDPVYLGEYPKNGLKVNAPYLGFVQSGDMDIIHQPLDYFCANIYSGRKVRAALDGGYEFFLEPINMPRTLMHWSIEPEALYYGPKFFYERYKLPIYITENGVALTDVISQDGKVHDPQRIDFTQKYLTTLLKATNDGIDIRGYFHWSLMDNFEWAEGYFPRFGLIYVDHVTQQRIVKDSAHWYRSVIKTNGKNLIG